VGLTDRLEGLFEEKRTQATFARVLAVMEDGHGYTPFVRSGH